MRQGEYRLASLPKAQMTPYRSVFYFIVQFAIVLYFIDMALQITAASPHPLPHANGSLLSTLRLPLLSERLHRASNRLEGNVQGRCLHNNEVLAFIFNALASFSGSEL